MRIRISIQRDDDEWKDACFVTLHDDGEISTETSPQARDGELFGAFNVLSDAIERWMLNHTKFA
jgi:hypothetical protein